MTNDTPVACSLGAGELQQRLAAIAETGASSLISREIEGDRHILRFRASQSARRRLEGIVAAEAECCSFLDLLLSEDGDELVLSIAAPKDAQTVADELAGAFGSGDRKNDRAAGSERTGVLIGAGGLALAVCCIAGPAILGVAIGATLGSALDIAAALLVGVGVAVVLHRRRRTRGKRG
jgi:hypothetical protein